MYTDYGIKPLCTRGSLVFRDAADESGANQTNLALKGIIGIKTMAEISRALGEQDDAQQYDVRHSSLWNNHSAHIV